MNEEPRYMQEQYKKQADDSQYQKTKAATAEQRHREERALAIQHRALKGGFGSRRNRRQTGVRVVSGNPDAIFSDTRGDDARSKNRISGVPTVNHEASKIGAPISLVPQNEEERQTLFEAEGSYSNDKGGEL